MTKTKQLQVKVKRLNEKAKLPYKATETSAGFDIVSTSAVFDENGCIVYGTGLSFEIPVGYAGFLFMRSSVAKKTLSLTNAVGVVDSDFRGEVTFKYRPSLRFGSTQRNLQYDVYKVGERIGQMIILPVPDIDFVEVDELSSTERGEGGYGSTGM